MKTTFITGCLSLLIASSVLGQDGNWTWMKGAQQANHTAIYGTQGIPSTNNNPPSLYTPCQWTDMEGNLWLFGGMDSRGMRYGDLWKYSPLTYEWTWINGTGTGDDPGYFGMKGVPSLSNVPPARSHGMATWTDKQNNLWMFGGIISSSTYVYKPVNDLWKYNISLNEWTWIGGPDTAGSRGNYGLKGVPDIANLPPSRSECVTAWMDSSGNAWMYGGLGWAGDVYNDLWKFNVDSNLWTWMAGSSSPRQQPIYGIKGVEDSSTTPGSRVCYAHWQDNSGNFWLMGGIIYKDSINCDNNLWKYNTRTNRWTWMNGTDSVISKGTYGSYCIMSDNNEPPALLENRACWTDKAGNFWLFGGYISLNANEATNGLWMYCVSNNNWSFIKGDTITNPPGNWGILGVPDVLNKPDGRAGSASWTDLAGNFYLYGGSTKDFPSVHSDLWKFTVDSSCAFCPASPNPVAFVSDMEAISIYPNPASTKLTIEASQLKENKIAGITIYNIIGQNVFSIQTDQNINPIYIDISSLPGGIYFIHLNGEKQQCVGRFIKN